jgi:hypothetical protein
MPWQIEGGGDMWQQIRGIVGGMLMLAVAGSAQAALLGLTSSTPDITLGSSYLIYDHDGGGANIGRLRVVAPSSILYEGSAAGGSQVTQSYLSAGDSSSDVMLTFDFNNATGTFLGGSVSVGLGNSTTAPRFSWSGTINNFGSQTGTGTIFDATWVVTADDYELMPANMNQFVDGYVTGLSGGVKITSSAAWGTGTNPFNNGSTNWFGNDWVFGSSTAANNPLINAYTAALSNPLRVASTVTADAWVPIPAAGWLLLSGLGLLAPTLRKSRIQSRSNATGTTPKELS